MTMTAHNPRVKGCPYRRVLPGVAFIHLIADKECSRKPLFTLSDATGGDVPSEQSGLGGGVAGFGFSNEKKV